MDNLNSPISTKETKFIVKIFPKRKLLDQMDLLGHFTEQQRNNIYNTQVLPIKQKKQIGMFPNSFYETSNTLPPKQTGILPEKKATK